MNRIRWISWLLVVALGAQLSGALRGLHEATAHGGDACYSCVLPGGNTPTERDHKPTPTPESPERDEDCQLCFFLSHGVVFSDDAGWAAVPPTLATGTVTLIDESLCVRIGVFVRRSRGPPAGRC